MKPTSRNRQPAFDKFQEQGFILANHNPIKVAIWAFALLSGRYKQGKRVLESASGEFCCLGVMCKVMGAKRTNKYGYVMYDGHHALVEPAAYLGGSERWGDYPDFPEANDNRDVTFREIGLFLLGTLNPWKQIHARLFGNR